MTMSYIVRRGIERSSGNLKAGTKLSAEDVAGWKNIPALLSVGQLAIDDGQIDPTNPAHRREFRPKPAEVALAPAAAQVAPVEPKPGKMCDVCGAGPFKRLDRHMLRHQGGE